MRGAAACATVCEAYTRAERPLKFESNIYGAPSVKRALAVAQHFKCAYCESKFLHSSYGDVDHFRPKAAVKQDHDGAEETPAYYWLAYDIENLLFTCEVCNRSHKRTLFPLVDARARARHHRSDLAAEESLIINPRLTDPGQHIGFRAEYPYPINGSRFGETTIRCLGRTRPVRAALRNDGWPA